MKNIVLLVASLITFGSVNAQDAISKTTNHLVTVAIPQVALIKVTPSPAGVRLQYQGPGTAGLNMADVNSSTSLVYLQYSSILPVATTATSRIIYITSDYAVGDDATNLKGITLTALATAPTLDATGQNSNGEFGAPVATPVPLLDANGNKVSTFTNANRLITGITSCFTGTSGTAGAPVTFSSTMNKLTKDQYANLRNRDYILTVTYTMADIL
jgi:hypothetical protein